MSTYPLFDDVLLQVSRFKAFYKISKASRRTFARDTSLVALSVRTGYLVDVIQIPEHLAEETFSSLLEQLATVSEHFNNVLHLYEPSGNQSFLVNKLLLLGKLEVLLDNNRSNIFPVFVQLPERGEPHKLDNIPLPLLDVLLFLSTNIKAGIASSASGPCTSLQLPQNLSSATLIPLAAILLDYPIAYVPASAHQISFLSGIPLVVYRCHIQIHEPATEESDATGEQHVLLQFSCPEQLTDSSSSTDMGGVVSHLETMFQARVTQLLPGSTFRVEQECVTLDRVAL